MNVITAIKPLKGRNKRWGIFLDGDFAFTLEAAVLSEAHLDVGRELSPQDIADLTQQDTFQRSLDAALRLLSYRARSESELRTRLRQRWSEKVLTRVMAKLNEQGLLDDESFARLWVTDRLSRSPRSARLLRQELRSKGISGETSGEATSEVDDETNAYRSGIKKASALAGTDFDVFRLRLGNYLQRRGFSYEVTRQVVITLWEEVRSKSVEKPEA